MEQERKDDYVSRKLWVKENMKNFETEMRREYVQQRGSRRGRRR